MPQLQAAAMDATTAIPQAQGSTQHEFLGLLGSPGEHCLPLAAIKWHTDVHQDKISTTSNKFQQVWPQKLNCSSLLYNFKLGFESQVEICLEYQTVLHL